MEYWQGNIYGVWRLIVYKDVYIKNGNTVKLKSSNKDYGVIAGGIENGEAITENTVIYAKSYS